MKLCLQCGNKELNDNCLEGNSCPECIYDCIEVDDLMADIILLLNNAGFETIHSCEGHLRANTYSVPYISMVDPEEKLEEYFNNLPDEIGGFYISYDVLQNIPKDFENTINVNKFILYFSFEPIGQKKKWYPKDQFVFGEKKVKMLKMIYSMLADYIILNKRKEKWKK